MKKDLFQELIGFIKRIRKSESAQTSVEYILLVGVMAFVIFTVLGNVRDRILADQNPCPPEDTSLGCSLSRVIDGFGTTDPNFRYFTLRK
ncbi:MAG: hypothetical protein VXV96_03030 [Bdellovibrionota bacterium]|jgi:Flp pilus assembly pilin Flp|nr:hypothetical protein [Bdellovibrionota bacterium]